MGRYSLQAYILNRNINYIKYVENKCNSTLVKQALNYKQSKMECRPTVLCLLQNHKNEEEIKRVSKYKLRRVIFEEFNKLCTTPNTKISEGRHFQIIQN